MTGRQHEHPRLRATSSTASPGAETGGRSSATSVPWSSSPAAGCARS